MPSRREVIEDLLAAIEQRFYELLPAQEFEHFFGGSVKIVYSALPKLEIDIRERKKSGPKLGSKNKPRVGPSKAAKKEIWRDEEQYGDNDAA
jgi:hypothetical protein